VLLLLLLVVVVVVLLRLVVVPHIVKGPRWKSFRLQRSHDVSLYRFTYICTTEFNISVVTSPGPLINHDFQKDSSRHALACSISQPVGVHAYYTVMVVVG